MASQKKWIAGATKKEGKLHEARAVLYEGLSYLFDDFNIASVHQLITDIDELLADRAVGDGESADALRAFYFSMTGEIDEAMVKV